MRVRFALIAAALLAATPALANDMTKCDPNGDCTYRWNDGAETRCKADYNDRDGRRCTDYVPGSLLVTPSGIPNLNLSDWKEVEALKAEARRASGYHDPGAIPLCPHGTHMTDDGCQGGRK